VPPQEVTSRDNVTIKVTAVLYFYVTDPNGAGGYQAETQGAVMGEWQTQDKINKRLVVVRVFCLSYLL
jgi:regulator of protease activity HflC (stomatin/prohibitin superfamily)